jgi:hypothetical protein
MANDPDLLRNTAAKLAQRDEAENAMVSTIALPQHPLGAGFLIIAKEGTYGALERALRALFALINFVRPSKATDIRSPSSLRPFIRDVRKGE